MFSKKKFILFFVTPAVVVLLLLGVYLRAKIGKNVNIAPASLSAPQPLQLKSLPEFSPPLDKAGQRVTKKVFGQFVTPQSSPVQPEKFTGYHTGVDFEILPDELNIPVTVHAVCTGKFLLGEYASGYGGVAVQSCSLNGRPITVVYGHLKLSSLTKAKSNTVNIGDVLGLLGANNSSETDGERKHLHLGFHLGTEVNILGYVQSPGELANWVDPCQFVCHD